MIYRRKILWNFINKIFNIIILVLYKVLFILLKIFIDEKKIFIVYKMKWKLNLKIINFLFYICNFS